MGTEVGNSPKTYGNCTIVNFKIPFKWVMILCCQTNQIYMAIWLVIMFWVADHFWNIAWCIYSNFVLTLIIVSCWHLIVRLLVWHRTKPTHHITSLLRPLRNVISIDVDSNGVYHQLEICLKIFLVKWKLKADKYFSWSWLMVTRIFSVPRNFLLYYHHRMI